MTSGTNLTSPQRVNPSRTYASDNFCRKSPRPMITLYSKDFQKTSPEKRQQLKKKVNFSIVCSSGFTVEHGIKNEVAEMLKEAFCDLRDLILNIQDAKLEAIEDFSINFDLSVAKYTDSETEDMVVVDLLNMENEENQQFVNSFLDQANKLLHFRAQSDRKVPKYGKGNLKGEKPLVRLESVLKKLPMTFAECATDHIPKKLASFPSSQRTIIIERLLFAEVLQKKFSEELALLIEKKQGELDKAIQEQSAPQMRKRVNELRKELLLLEALLVHIKQIDAYALTMVLITYPTTKAYPEEINACAKKIEEEILKVLKYNPSYKLEANMRAIAAYACDVGGMFYTPRWDYHQYCRKKEVKMKQSRIEDFMLLEAISYVDGKRQQGQFIIQAIYEEVTDEIRTEIQNIMSGIDFPNILPKIPEGENHDFQALRRSIPGLEMNSSKSNSDPCAVM